MRATQPPPRQTLLTQGSGPHTHTSSPQFAVVHPEQDIYHLPTQPTYITTRLGIRYCTVAMFTRKTRIYLDCARFRHALSVLHCWPRRHFDIKQIFMELCLVY